MNPLTNMRNVTKLSQRELDVNSKVSWHDEYRDSAWVFVGGLPFDLTEGDILAIFSQYGEIVNLNLVRDKATGKSKGFCFVCYENQKSTVLTVDNMNGIKILGRSIRVDHVKDYKPPKDSDKLDDITRMIHAQGVAPETMPELEKTIGEYELLEDENDEEENKEDDYRDDGLGSHSVLKGFKDTYSSIKQERHSPKPTRNDSRSDRTKREDERNQRDRRDTREIRDSNKRRHSPSPPRRERQSRPEMYEKEDERNQRDRRDTREIRESKRQHSPSPPPRREQQSRHELDEKEDSRKKHKSHSSKKSKKSKHSKSKKDKKRSKHKKRKASSSDSSSSESSDEDSSESESESSDESNRKSKKHRRHKK